MTHKPPTTTDHDRERPHTAPALILGTTTEGWVLVVACILLVLAVGFGGIEGILLWVLYALLLVALIRLVLVLA